MFPYLIWIFSNSFKLHDLFDDMDLPDLGLFLTHWSPKDGKLFVYFVQILTTLPHFNGLVNTSGNNKRTSSMEVYWCAKMRVSIQPVNKISYCFKLKYIKSQKYPIRYKLVSIFINFIPFTTTTVTNIPYP